MKRALLDSLEQHERERQHARERYAAERAGEDTSAIARGRQAKLEAQREADRRWKETIVYRTQAGVYIVAGRDRLGKFHFGSARESWQAAFAEADKRG
jgi:hypothetical protein